MYRPGPANPSSIGVDAATVTLWRKAMYQWQRFMKQTDTSQSREIAQTYYKAPKAMLEDNADGNEVLEVFLEKIQRAAVKEHASSNNDDEPPKDESSCEMESVDSSMSCKPPQLVDNQNRNSSCDQFLAMRIAAERAMQLEHVTQSPQHMGVENVGLVGESSSPTILAFPTKADVRYSVARGTCLEFAAAVQNLSDVRQRQPDPIKWSELPRCLSVEFQETNAVGCICGNEVSPNKLDDHLRKCRVFRDTWEAAIRHFISRRGVSHVRRLITKVSAHRLSDDTMSMCALVESKGEVDESVRKLGDYEYRKEMRRVTELFEFTQFLQPKTATYAQTRLVGHELNLNLQL